MRAWLEIAASPVLLVALGLVVLTGLTYWKSHARLLRGFTLVLTATYWLLSMPLTANFALGELEHAARQDETCPPPPDGTIFIVLAGGIYGHPRSATAFSDLHSASLDRILAATMLALHTPNSQLLISGGAGGKYREADIMSALAQQMGFPAARIILDRSARTTYESAVNVAKLLAHEPNAPRYLLTSAYHIPRAYLAFTRTKQRVCAYPLDQRAIRAPAYDLLTPQLSALAKMSQALHEFMGLQAYRWATFE